MSTRGPTTPMGSKGPKQIYAQGFAEQALVYGAEEQEGKSCCKVIAKMISQHVQKTLSDTLFFFFFWKYML